MDTNTYVGKIKRTRKRWRKYSRQLRKAGFNPEYHVADYRIRYLPEPEVFKLLTLGVDAWYPMSCNENINFGVDLANGKDETVYAVHYVPTNPHTS